MNDKLKELYEKVSGDDNLKESFTKGLEAITNDDEKKSFIIDFAKEQGITLTDEDFPKTAVMEGLSDDELENVAGGAFGDAAKKRCGEAAFIACSAALAAAGFAAIGDC